MRKLIFISLFLITAIFSAFSQQKKEDFISFIQDEHAWVDSVFNSLSAKERVAQMFMVRAHSNLGQRYIDSVARIIEREQLGGIVLFQGGPVRHAHVINQYQKVAKVPLLVAFDGEWGLGMRLPDSTISYPYQMTLGAIQNDALLYQMGREIARDFKRLGMNVNFAPVVDVNNNPRNPVINFRSFGENKENVTVKGLAYMNGMMDEGIIVSLKHFPGHGDTDVDSHYDLPVLPFSRGRLDSLEMYPFRKLIDAGASGVMVAHMHIPSLDATPNLPSSISKPIVTGILKEELGFKGLIFTDAMDMRGVVKFFPKGEADVRAIIAGNDLLELSENSARAIDLVLAAIKKNQISQAEIDARVKKILASKYWLNLQKEEVRNVEINNLHAELNRPSSARLNQRLADAAITVLNSDSMIRHMDWTKRTAVLAIGVTSLPEFQKQMIGRFDNQLLFLLPPDASDEELTEMLKELESYDQFVVSLHDNRGRPRSTLHYNSNIKLLISELAQRNTVFCVFANPYTLAGLPGIEHARTILVGYQNEDIIQRAAAKAIRRTIRPSGRLPVTINAYFKAGDGIR